MDPLLASIVEFWWIAPAAVGAGALGVVGLRHQSRQRRSNRRLAYDAARHQLRSAQADVVATRSNARVARAELARIQAERAAGRATPARVAEARQTAQTAQRDQKVAAATLRSRRVQLGAARAMLPHTRDPARHPLIQLTAAHDAVTARWMAYETDPAKLIAFPTMSDARVPTTAAYLAAQQEAQRLRPASPDARMSPADYAAFHDAVDRQTSAFAVAEEAAWRHARAAGDVPRQAPGPGAEQPWTVIAQGAVVRSTEILSRVAEQAAAAVREARDLRDARDPRARRESADRPDAAASAPPRPGSSSTPDPTPRDTSSPSDNPRPRADPPESPHPPDPPSSERRTIWPVPGRRATPPST